MTAVAAGSRRRLKSEFIACLLLIQLFLPMAARGDGKVYPYQEHVPAFTPYQRAFISYQDGQELLAIQIKFEGKGNEFGWVVPVPAPPELESMNGKDADRVFRDFERNSREKVHSIFNLVVQPVLYALLFTYLFLKGFHVVVATAVAAVGVFIPFAYLQIEFGWEELLPLLIFVISTVLFCLLLVPFIRQRWPGWSAKKMSAVSQFLLSLMVFVLLVTLIVPTFGGGSSSTEVNIISKNKVGIYDTMVIEASDSGELIKWLNDHEFKYEDRDKQVFDRYLEKGWCFVTARINVKDRAGDRFKSVEGLVDPLLLLFPSEEIVYPMALTGTAGSKVKVLLYVFADGSLTTGGPVKKLFADTKQFNAHLLFGIKRKNPPFDFIEATPEAGWINKFRGVIKPEDMHEDIVFSIDEEQRYEPFRAETIRF